MASLYNVGLGVLRLGLKIEVLEIPWHFLGLGSHVTCRSRDGITGVCPMGKVYIDGRR